MSETINFNTILSLIDCSIKPHYLNRTQELVLQEVWNGKTYSKIAHDRNYDPEYIKTVGCNLWKILSFAFNEPINKSNFVPFMRHKISTIESPESEDIKTVKTSQLELVSHQVQLDSDWVTVPDIDCFMGRDNEIDTLKSYSQNTNCNSIVVSGMVGSGKTSLLKKIAAEIKHKFDYVVWFDLSNPLPVITLVNDCLKRIDKNYNQNFDRTNFRQQDLSSLLSYFINCLRSNKVLLLLDNLESILEISGNNFCYKSGLEKYGDFLRSVISSNHQSLLICGSRVKPKFFNFYGMNQVKLLELQGLDQKYVGEFLAARKASIVNEKKFLNLSNSLQNNLKLLHIADKYMTLLDEYLDNLQQISNELSRLEVVANMLEQELNCLLKLEKKIVFWLAISGDPVSYEDLVNQTNCHNSKIKFLNTIQFLKKRSLINEQNSKLSLMPVMKSYLRRKIVTEAL